MGTAITRSYSDVGTYDITTGERLPLWQDGEHLEGDTLGLLDVDVTSSQK